jgi:hypothetical protein
MSNIIQIEELVYSRLPRISKSEWLKMLSKQGVSNDYALLLDDYLLIEQTDYRFSNGNYISSERTVYNIDYTTYDTAENTPNPDNTEEIITVRYDSTHDRYYVYYTHFPIEDIPHTPDLSHILSEADIPSSHPFVQAPAEKHVDTPVTPRAAQPAPQPKPEPAPTPSFTSTEYHKPWRQKTLSELRRLYNAGKSLKEIASIMGKFEVSIVYQLKTYLGVEHPFEKAPQQPVSKPQSRTQPKPQTPTSMNGIEYYKDLFRNMRRAKNEFGELAPHKVILLLTIIRRYHSYTGYTINKDINLQISFMDCWTKYVKASHWNPNLNMPWEHMPSEPFWQQASNPKQATIDVQLQKLIVNSETRRELKETLIAML